MSAVTVNNGEFHIMALSALFESPLNNRKHYDEKKLAELTESIRVKGVLTPLLARPNSGAFEIAAGHRRYRAALAAGVVDLPVLVREMTDAEFLEVLTIENLQREDVHPLDEANGYKQLMQKHGYTADTIAEKVGKSKEYVYARMKLAALIPELQARFFEDKITAGHAILLARLPAESQAIAAKEVFDQEYFADPATGESKQEKVTISVRDLQSFIRREIQMDLSKAPFDIADPDLVRKAGACIACPKRTGAEPQLWPELGQRDLCGDRSCYHKKLNAYIEDQVSTSAMIRLTDDWSKHDKKGFTYVDYNTAKIKPGTKTCESAVIGIYVDGHNRGETLKICPNRSCKVHYRNNGSSSYVAPKKTPAEQLKNAQQAITASMDAELRTKLYQAAVQRIDLIGTDLQKLMKKPVMQMILRLVYDRLDSSVRAKVTQELKLRKAQYSQSAQDKELDTYSEKLASAEILALAIKLGLRNLSMNFRGGWNDQDDQCVKDLAEIATQYGAKTGPIKDEVAKLKKEKMARAKSRIESAKKTSKGKKSKKVQTSTEADDVDDDLEGDEE